MKHQDKNFHSTLEAATRITPHAAFTALAIDAALLQVNDQLPALSDAEQARVIDAAQVAAQTVLALANVPTDWLSFIEALRHDRSEQVRRLLWEIIDEHLPCDAARLFSEEKIAAVDRLRVLVRPGTHEALHDALFALEDAYLGHVLATVEEAFILGFEIAHNPAKLLLERVGE